MVGFSAYPALAVGVGGSSPGEMTNCQQDSVPSPHNPVCQSQMFPLTFLYEIPTKHVSFFVPCDRLPLALSFRVTA